jgi:hypothetical protein
VAIRNLTKAAKSAAVPPIDLAKKIDIDWPHHDQLELAASYIEKAMGQIRICIAALGSPADDCLGYTRKALIRMLDEDIHNALDAAREIFETWKSQEVAHG